VSEKRHSSRGPKRHPQSKGYSSLPSEAALHAARDRFADLLGRTDSLERDWQQLFAEEPLILSESLPLRLRPSQIVPRGRPGQSEADFVFYPDGDLILPSSYGVIELKRPSTPILSTPRRQVLKLSSDAETAHAQAKVYAAELTRELYDIPERLIAVGGGAHIFLIIGSSRELRAKVVTDLQRQQFDSLLLGGVELLPYDTLFRMFEARVPPQIHIIVPATSAARADTTGGIPLAQLGSVFISYARPDSEFARRLSDELEVAGVRVWNYLRDLRTSNDIQAEIENAIAEASTVVLVLSQASSWRDAVGWELMKVLERQSRLGRDMLIPIALDHSWRESPLSSVLQDYSVLDFSGWQNSELFRKQIEGLVASLLIIGA